MNIRSGKDISLRFPSLFSGLFLLILNIALFPALSHAQSCSVTSVESGKQIRACQMEDMRSLINQARAACAVSPIAAFPFSDQPIIPGKTAISIRHINEMKTAITEISSQCGNPRPPPTFKSIAAGDVISSTDFVSLYNTFVFTSFCGDSICQTGEEDITTCPVDCGGAAEFYCNGIGGCYAAVTCPSGKRCYSQLQNCLDNISQDCAPCVPSCRGRSRRYNCESWSDGCGGLCFGTKTPSCACANTICEGDSCTDVCGGICQGKLKSDCACAGGICSTDTCVDQCGGTCVGTLASDCSCASSTCTGDTCADACGGTCAGTMPPDCSCAADTCTGQTCGDGCGGTCAGTKSPDCSCASNTCTGQTCDDGCGGTCAGTMPPDCSCSSSTCWDDMCDDGCSGTCAGTKTTCQLVVNEQCGSNPSISVNACGNNPAISGYYYYRCNGSCMPTDADIISGLIANCTPFVDTNVVPGQRYSYAAKFYDNSTGTYSVMSDRTTVRLNTPNCSCAANTCAGDTCSDGCGGTCAGTMAPDCSCATDTCTNDTCSDGCGGTCVGTVPPDCSCALDTCTGETCSDGCGGTCPGTKICQPPVYPPIECKKWSCSGSGFCLQDHTDTCACPAGKKPVCKSAPATGCGGGFCPDTACDCVD